MMTYRSRSQMLATEQASQRKWINDHGGDLAGYIERYGDPDRDHCYGEGGTAIYRADVAELERINKIIRS